MHIASDRNLVDVRFPVQYVIRPQSKVHHDYRGYAGTVAGGILKPGDEVMVLPSGFTSRIARHPNGRRGRSRRPWRRWRSRSCSRTTSTSAGGDMICRPNNQATPSQDLEAMVCWMSEASQLNEGSKLAIKHTTKWARALVKDFRYRLDVNTLHRQEDATSLGLNEIGRVRLRTTQPLLVDEYHRNRNTGSFILVDESTNVTVGAGMIVHAD